MDNTRIILLAHGKRGYGMAAFNLAMTIKHYGCVIPVHLFAESKTFEGIPLNFFDHITWIEPDFYTGINGNRDISLSKINIVRDLPAMHNFYLDVDAMALKDITPFIEQVIKVNKPYVTDVVGVGKKGSEIPYDVWAKHEYAWPFFGLDDESEWCSIQSSWAYFHEDCKKTFYPLLKHYHEKRYPLTELKEPWANDQLPDEILFSGVCAKIDYNPNCEIKPMFFGTSPMRNVSEIHNTHYLLSMFGNGSFNSRRSLTKSMYQEYYSKKVIEIGRNYGNVGYKKEYVMRDKIVNDVKKLN